MKQAKNKHKWVDKGVEAGIGKTNIFICANCRKKKIKHDFVDFVTYDYFDENNNPLGDFPPKCN